MLELWGGGDISCGTAGPQGTFRQGEQVAICVLERACVETVAYKALWMLVVSLSSRQDPFKPPQQRPEAPDIDPCFKPLDTSKEGD